MARGIRPRVPPDVDPAAREILARRAERLRAPAPAIVDEAVVWVAEFPVGEDRFALPLDRLRAVVPLRRVTPVPMARPHIIGILRYQGQIVTAVSLAALLGIRGWSQDPSVLMIVDPGWGPLTALDCEQIPKPSTVPARSLAAARTGERAAVVEVTTGAHVVHVLDLARLLDRRSGSRGGS